MELETGMSYWRAGALSFLHEAGLTSGIHGHDNAEQPASAAHASAGNLPATVPAYAN